MPKRRRYKIYRFIHDLPDPDFAGKSIRKRSNPKGFKL